MSIWIGCSNKAINNNNNNNNDDDDDDDDDDDYYYYYNTIIINCFRPTLTFHTLEGGGGGGGVVEGLSLPQKLLTFITFFLMKQRNERSNSKARFVAIYLASI